MAASNLSTALSGADRKFGVDHLEKYIEKFNDLDPIYYLIDRFLKDYQATDKNQLLDRAASLMDEFQSVVRELNTKPRSVA